MYKRLKRRDDGLDADRNGEESDRPCSEWLAQVSERAEIAIGTAITLESAPMPIIEPIPNSAI